MQTTGFVSGPVAEGLTVRLAFGALRQDDYQHSITRSDCLAEKRYAAGRLLVDWQPNDAWHISLNANGSFDTSQPPASQLIAVSAEVIMWSFNKTAYQLHYRGNLNVETAT